MKGYRDRGLPLEPFVGLLLFAIRAGIPWTLDGRFCVRRRRQDGAWRGGWCGGSAPLPEAAGGTDGDAERPGFASARRRADSR
jgi:hypothetical protein